MKLSYEQKKQIYDDGYVVVPGVIPRIMVDQALKSIHHTMGIGQEMKDLSVHPAITDLFNKSPAKQLVDSVIGEGMFHPIRNAQVALRYPLYDDPAPQPKPHLDGMLALKDGLVQNFTALVGVFLSDLPVTNGGNFTVYPGSHRSYEQYFREQGPEILLQDESFRTLHHSPNVALAKPVPITGKAGDIIITHYQLVHAVGPNIWHNIRYACFFRVDHVDRQVDWKRSITDLWIHWEGMKDFVQQ